MEKNEKTLNSNENIFDSNTIIFKPEKSKEDERVTIIDDRFDFEVKFEDENKKLMSKSLSISRSSKSFFQFDRIYWVDSLRIFSNYLVILLQCSFYVNMQIPSMTSRKNGAIFWDAISRSCVPLFIMISGIYFLDPDREIPFLKLFKKYIFRIIKCLLFWNIFYATIVKFLVNPYKTQYTWNFKLVKDILEEIFFGKYHLWYLYMCVGLYVITPIIRSITKSRMIIEYYIILGVGILSPISFIILIIREYLPKNVIDDKTTDFINKFMIFITYGYTCYYILGYYLTQIKNGNKVKLYLIYLIGLISLYGTYELEINLNYKDNQEHSDFTDFNSFNITVSAISIFIFFKETVNKLLEKLINISGFKNLLVTLSNLSFGCYLISAFYFELFYRINFRPYTTYTYISIPFYSTIIWLSCNITIFIIKKIPILRSFV